MNKLESLQDIKKQIRQSYAKLSARERLIVLGAVLVLGLLTLYKLYEVTEEAFAEQSAKVEKLERDMKTVAFELGNYAKAKARKEAIEKVYKEVEIKEGALSHLENLVRTKANIPQGQFTITERPARKYGLNYEQLSFTIKFTTVNLQHLLDFLKELSYGDKPLIVADLKLTKNRISQSLEVELNVSSMRQAAAEGSSSPEIQPAEDQA